VHAPLARACWHAGPGYNQRTIAVEYNGDILHRQFWETTQLAEGDRLEVVTIVGGGASGSQSV